MIQWSPLTRGSSSARNSANRGPPGIAAARVRHTALHVHVGFLRGPRVPYPRTPARTLKGMAAYDSRVRRILGGVFWLSLYVLLSLAPLLVAFAYRDHPPREF